MALLRTRIVRRATTTSITPRSFPARAAQRNRESYFATLRANLPEATPKVVPPLMNAAQRHALRDAAPLLKLPDGWMSSTNDILAHSMRGVLSEEEWSHTRDFFLSAMIHPSFIPAQRGTSGTSSELRALIAMPAELHLSGHAVLQLLQELVHAHKPPVNAGRDEPESDDDHPTRRKGGPVRHSHVPLNVTTPLLPPTPLTTAALATLPSTVGWERAILFDPSLCTASSSPVPTKVPSDVLLASTTALCGALDLTGGLFAVARFLDLHLPTPPPR